MYSRLRSTSLLAVAGVLLVLAACQKELDLATGGAAEPFSLTVDLKPYVNSSPLQFGVPYLNSTGESYTISAFKFYVHNATLVNTETNVSRSLKPGEHFLVDAAKPASQLLNFQSESGAYNAISLTIGVDSSRNFSGAQTAALDPTLGMFWTWNSGYIMAKLEGNSPSSSQPNQAIEYHIGGYKAPNSVLKTVILPFPNSAPYGFAAGSTSTITIEAHADTWFSGPNPVSIAATPVCMTPGDLALRMADNYSRMLRISEVTKN